MVKEIRANDGEYEVTTFSSGVKVELKTKDLRPQADIDAENAIRLAEANKRKAMELTEMRKTLIGLQNKKTEFITNSWDVTELDKQINEINKRITELI